MDELGVIHGRFQVLHNDHMKYLLAGKERCKHLIIGICNPEIDLTKYTSSNPHRSKRSSNPLTYFERMECIKYSMIEAGVNQEEFDIVPFPINFPEKIYNYAPKNAKYYFTQASVKRALPAEQVKEIANNYGLKGEAYSSVEKALTIAKNNAKENDLIFIGGSTFIVADLIVLYKSHKL